MIILIMNVSTDVRGLLELAAERFIQKIDGLKGKTGVRIAELPTFEEFLGFARSQPRDPKEKFLVFKEMRSGTAYQSWPSDVGISAPEVINLGAKISGDPRRLSSEVWAEVQEGISYECLDYTKVFVPSGEKGFASPKLVLVFRLNPMSSVARDGLGVFYRIRFDRGGSGEKSIHEWKPPEGVVFSDDILHLYGVTGRTVGGYFCSEHVIFGSPQEQTLWFFGGKLPIFDGVTDSPNLRLAALLARESHDLVPGQELGVVVLRCGQMTDFFNNECIGVTFNEQKISCIMHEKPKGYSYKSTEAVRVTTQGIYLVCMKEEDDMIALRQGILPIVMDFGPTLEQFRQRVSVLGEPLRTELLHMYLTFLQHEENIRRLLYQPQSSQLNGTQLELPF
ncbi:MAG: hypothetical protein NZO16_00795 [Deltaproteobacteria bacterium]|nr:hypothetical protein [Deltaproteobacteria bacterium]